MFPKEDNSNIMVGIDPILAMSKEKLRTNLQSSGYIMAIILHVHPRINELEEL